MTTRFTVPDGQTGTVDVKVNGKKVASLDLQSKWAWQYVDGDKVYDNATSSSKARFRFDEVHTLLKDTIKAGDTVTIENTSSTRIGIDFIELEQAPEIISQPENSISITDKGAVANDGKDDSKALEDALYEASVTGKNVYIPAGTFTFDKKLQFSVQMLKYKALVCGIQIYNSLVIKKMVVDLVLSKVLIM